MSVLLFHQQHLVIAVRGLAVHLMWKLSLSPETVLSRLRRAVCHRPHSLLSDRWELLTSTELCLSAHTKDPVKEREGRTNGEKEARERGWRGDGGGEERKETR